MSSLSLPGLLFVFISSRDSRMVRGHKALRYHRRSLRALRSWTGARRRDLPGDRHEPPRDCHNLKCRSESEPWHRDRQHPRWNSYPDCRARRPRCSRSKGKVPVDVSGGLPRLGVGPKAFATLPYLIGTPEKIRGALVIALWCKEGGFMIGAYPHHMTIPREGFGVLRHIMVLQGTESSSLL